ncbi:tetratricopeptide repeat protein 13-like isoform X2 [Gigantopelta aegis]|uniref:tetratricopeptide repeat protein 13-like isoform X2 n=1 Tax=Gigantopelta aegis TaxID=1735272 RepID=UPI001B88C779|nr:tetratricopeptide repeat protein 13-like isoform X2 [Gigantopelta aegis]
MVVLSLLTFCILFINSQGDSQFCEIANVQIENEDGRRQVFELKRIEPVKGGPCLLCAWKSSSGTWETSPLRFSLLLTPGEVVAECDDAKHNLPVGLCAASKEVNSCSEEDATLSEDTGSCQNPQALADRIVDEGLVPMATGRDHIDKKIALAVVLTNLGSFSKAIGTFTDILKKHPDVVAAYYGRGVAYARKGLNLAENAVLALADFSEAIKKDKDRYEAYERRSEVYMGLGHYSEALDDMTVAINHRPTEKLYFMRGVVNLLLENYADAEKDFRRNLESEGQMYIASYFNLGLALYYRGRVRNAIEVFKEVLKLQPDHIDACTSLAQAFKELGNLKAARNRFNQSLNIKPNHPLSLQLFGGMMYHSGDPASALTHFQKCLSVDSENIHCQYMQGLSYLAMGKFYEGIKASTKVMVNNRGALKMSPEFMKAHYLREYGRYLHARLDLTLDQLKPDFELKEEFKDHWVKSLQFQFKNTYQEQPGLQPDIGDISMMSLQDYPSNVRSLICKAEKVGGLTQVNSDGFTSNKRLNLAMGLATIHIAQYLEARWKSFKQNKTPTDKPINWREVYRIGVQYRRLVDPDQPLFWVDSLPDHLLSDGFRSDITFVRGSVMNLKVMPYYDLVFKLAKTMLEHYTGDGAVVYSNLKEDIGKAKTCDDLLTVARKRKINPHGFLVATQVPSTMKAKETDRLDGAMLILTEDLNGKIVFSLNIANTQERMTTYYSELDFIFNQIQDEIRRTGVSKIADVDSIMNLILSLVYYLYNLMPLTRGSSVVAYSMALGLVMSLGRQVTGKIPTGKLLELEAMLSGAPDAFIIVTKQWMNVKRSSQSVSSLPKVNEVFPTVRSVIEVLNVNTASC